MTERSIFLIGTHEGVHVVASKELVSEPSGPGKTSYFSDDGSLGLDISTPECEQHYGVIPSYGEILQVTMQIGEFVVE